MDLPPIPDPERLTGPAIDALRSVPGGDALVFTASAADETEGMASPFLDSLRSAWGPERAALADVFLFGTAVPAEGFAAADDLLAVGLLDDVGGGHVASRFRVSPVLGLAVVADAPLGHPEAILPPSPTTASLAAVVPPGPAGRRVLDVGCGAGTVTIAAGAGTAVDRSARAAALTRLNAAVNGGAALDARVGDLVAPVSGERFDLVLSQPPYLALPPGVPATPYLHGGVTGDEVTRRLLEDVPPVLADRGIALVRADRPADAPPFAGVEVSWPGPDVDGLADAYAAVHVPAEGDERAEVAAAYRAHLRPLRSALVVLDADGRRGRVETFGAPRDWATLRVLAGVPGFPP